MIQKSSLSFFIIEEPCLWVERKAEEAESQLIHMIVIAIITTVNNCAVKKKLYDIHIYSLI